MEGNNKNPCNPTALWSPVVTLEPRLDDISPAQKRSLSFKVTSTVVEPEQGLEGLY
jgi:hypothetical protein